MWWDGAIVLLSIRPPSVSVGLAGDTDYYRTGKDARHEELIPPSDVACDVLVLLLSVHMTPRPGPSLCLSKQCGFTSQWPGAAAGSPSPVQTLPWSP